MKRRSRAGCALAALAALGCVAAPVAPDAPPGAARSGRVLVFYPAGACTGDLELELFQREAGEWRPHPEHPRLAPGSCALEAAGQLLNELRVRCADPKGVRPPSEWVVGAELAASPGQCPRPAMP